MSSTVAYRADIDGLRALAVLAVILFHLDPSWLPGGFVGVDVFFVISGYLISRILHDGIREGSFSFAEFYARRMRRIVPALAFVILTRRLFFS
jgi:peptidoglycan/LPS O-acetylase OafA/YrhL